MTQQKSCEASQMLREFLNIEALIRVACNTDFKCTFCLSSGETLEDRLCVCAVQILASKLTLTVLYAYAFLLRPFYRFFSHFSLSYSHSICVVVSAFLFFSNVFYSLCCAIRFHFSVVYSSFGFGAWFQFFQRTCFDVDYYYVFFISCCFCYGSFIFHRHFSFFFISFYFKQKKTEIYKKNTCTLST